MIETRLLSGGRGTDTIRTIGSSEIERLVQYPGYDALHQLLRFE